MSCSGIYCYVDNQNNDIVYIGKDTQIDNNKRHKDHTEKWSYNKQQINRVIQNNPNRYDYRILAKGNFSDDELNQLEISFIKMYGTYENEDKFNYTPGGDGLNGRNHPSYKKEMRIISNGVDKGYSLKYDMKKICTNKDYNFLKNLCDKFNKNEISIRKIIALNQKDFKKRARNYKKGKNKTGYFRVMKTQQGGKPYYRYNYTVNGKRYSINSVSIDELEELVKAKGLTWINFNKGEEIK